MPNWQAYSILQVNDVSSLDSLPQKKETLSYQDSLWTALQTNLYIGSPPEEKDEIHFLIQHEIKPFEDLSHQSSGFDWFFIISLLFLSLLAIIRLRSAKTFGISYNVLLKGKLTDRNYDNQHSFSQRLYLPLFFCSWIGISFILYVSMFFCIDNNYLTLPQTDKNFILKFAFIFIAAYFVIRFVLFKLISLLFNLKNIMPEYQYLLGSMDFILAILSFPFVFIYAYYGMPPFYGNEYPLLANILLIFIFLIFTVLIIYKTIRGWGIFKKNFHLHEYLLYLCTIEFLPLLVFLKFSIGSLLNH